MTSEVQGEYIAQNVKVDTQCDDMGEKARKCSNLGQPEYNLLRKSRLEGRTHS